jgi:hypothetical protein
MYEPTSIIGKLRKKVVMVHFKVKSSYMEGLRRALKILGQPKIQTSTSLIQVRHATASWICSVNSN